MSSPSKEATVADLIRVLKTAMESIGDAHVSAAKALDNEPASVVVLALYLVYKRLADMHSHGAELVSERTMKELDDLMKRSMLDANEVFHGKVASA